jgi:hypothetical protein
MQDDATKRKRYDMWKIRGYESTRRWSSAANTALGMDVVLADEAIGTLIPGRLIALAKMIEQEYAANKKTL